MSRGIRPINPNSIAELCAEREKRALASAPQPMPPSIPAVCAAYAGRIFQNPHNVDRGMRAEEKGKRRGNGCRPGRNDEKRNPEVECRAAQHKNDGGDLNSRTERELA